MTRSEWPKRALGEICTFHYGKALPASKRTGAGYPVYGSNGEVGRHAAALTDGPTIIVGRKGSFGEVHFSSQPCWPIDTTYYIDAHATEANLRWLAYSLRALGLTGLNRAAAIPGLNREDAYRQRLLVPPVEEQRQIAAVLDQADRLRSAHQYSDGLVRSFTEAALRDVLSSISVDRARWPQLGAFADIQGGLQVVRSRSGYPMRVPYLRVANVYRGRLALAEVKQLGVTPAELDRTRLVSGDLLVVEGHGNRDEIGRVGRWGGEISDCVHQNHLIRVRVDPAMAYSRYVEAFLNSELGRRALRRAARTTSGLNTISTGDVRSVPVPLPSHEVQARLDAQMARASRLEQVYVRREARLDDLFEGLLHRAFQGTSQ